MNGLWMWITKSFNNRELASSAIWLGQIRFIWVHIRRQ